MLQPLMSPPLRLVADAKLQPVMSPSLRHVADARRQGRLLRPPTHGAGKRSFEFFFPFTRNLPALSTRLNTSSFRYIRIKLGTLSLAHKSEASYHTRRFL